MGKEIAIIGAGISGITSAIKFAQNRHNNIDVFEKRDFILKGPPYCHLHAGGILYPEISLKDAQTLLQDSIQFANKFSDCLDYRPTIVAFRSTSKYSADSLLLKCYANRLNYQFHDTRPFGEVENFYAIYNLSDMVYFKIHGRLPESQDSSRSFHDKYVEKFCRLLDDIYSIKYPFISVNEPGISQSKVESRLTKELSVHNNINLIINHKVVLDELKNYDIIVNASGKNMFSELFGLDKQEIYEFKSSWLIELPIEMRDMPEIALIGERETTNAMIQITPLGSDLFQIHCMRSDSSIINTFDCPQESLYLSDNEILNRGNVAIREISKFFPLFIFCKVNGACPGLQRIPYFSKSKRISDVKLIELNNVTYIDIHTLKACSVVSLVNKIVRLNNWTVGSSR
jgi:hypothetical protein